MNRIRYHCSEAVIDYPILRLNDKSTGTALFKSTQNKTDESMVHGRFLQSPQTE
jgi:hypothetical protein